MKKRNRAIASTTVLSLILTSTMTMTNVQAADGVTRVTGTDRENTSMEVAKEVFGTAETVVLVNGYGYADAVSATPLAKALDAPILLTNNVDYPSYKLTSTLNKLGTKKIVLVGGTGVITPALESELERNYKVERIGGNSRYETNAAVAKKVLNLTGEKSAILVSGEGYADALSVASIAANKGVPILFGNSAEVPYEVRSVARGLNVMAVGGSGVLPEYVLNTVDATRVAEGASRFDTNLAVLKYFKKDLKLDNIYVAAGGSKATDFADALVASAAAAKVGAPVVLTGVGANGSAVDKANKYVKDNITKDSKVTIVGGKGSVSESIVDDLEYIAKKAKNPNQGSGGGIIDDEDDYYDDDDYRDVKVRTVTATTDELDLAKSEKDLKLGFKVNGGITNLTALENSGYEIEFLATEDVLLDGDGDETGKIDKEKLRNNVGEGETFEYQVVIYDEDGDEVERSKAVEVEVVDNFTEAKAIDGVTIELGNGIEVKSGKIQVDETAQITEVEYTTSNGIEQVIDSGEFVERNVKFTSLNPGVAVVGKEGEITPVKAGSTTITIEVKGLKRQVKITVVEDEREPKKATANASNIKIGDDTKKDIEVTVLDQYGDAIEDVSFGDIEIENSDEDIIAVAEPDGETDEEGKVVFTVNAAHAKATEVGTGKFYIKGKYNNKNGSLLATISVEVTALNDTDSRKLEKMDSKKDYKLDKADEDDDSLELAYNKYTSKGAYLGREESMTDSADKYKEANKDSKDDIENIRYLVESSNTDIIKVELSGDDIIKVTPGTKTGTASVRVLENGVSRASQSITVVNNNPRITSARFQTTKITDVQTIDLDEEVLKPSNITVANKKGITRIDDDGTIYLDLDNDGGYNGDDIKLGMLKVSNYSIYDDDDNVVKINVYDDKNGDNYGYISDNSGEIKTDEGNGKFRPGTKGTIVFKIIDTEDTDNDGKKDDSLDDGTITINIED